MINPEAVHPLSRKGALHGKVLLLGMDGLSDDFLSAPIVRESMPNLAAFLTQATRGPLMSTFPPYTAPAWTTITTGVDPGRHGIYGFTDRNNHPVSDSDVRSPRIWDYVGAVGGRSVVVNVPITYPPRAIDGVLVSGMPSPPETGYTFPRDLARSLDQLGYVVDVSVASRARESRATLDRLRVMTEARGRAAVQLARAYDWDLFTLIFVLPDRLGHPWWKYLVPGDPHYETRQGEAVREGARGALQAMDRAVGDVFAVLPSATSVVLCSDHGFGPVSGDLFFDLVLAGAGLIDAAPSSAGRALMARLGRSRIGRMAPGPLYSWVRQKARTVRGSTRRAWTAAGYESGVRLADPSDDEGIKIVTELLLDLRNPSGQRIVKSVNRGEEVYPGTNAPDLLCAMEDESINLHEGLHAPGQWVSRQAEPWGTHASRGVVAIQGGAAIDVQGNAADICPTVLTLLGLRADGLDGRSLVQAETLAPVNVDSPNGKGRQTEQVYSEDQEAAVLEHLRGLGYVE